MVFKEETKSK